MSLSTQLQITQRSIKIGKLVERGITTRKMVLSGVVRYNKDAKMLEKDIKDVSTAFAQLGLMVVGLIPAGGGGGSGSGNLDNQTTHTFIGNVSAICPLPGLGWLGEFPLSALTAYQINDSILKCGKTVYVLAMTGSGQARQIIAWFQKKAYTYIRNNNAVQKVQRNVADPVSNSIYGLMPRVETLIKEHLFMLKFDSGRTYEMNFSQSFDEKKCIRKGFLKEWRSLLLFLLFMSYSFLGMAQSSADIQSYISQYKQIALEQERTYGIPAPITLAQGILESGAGKSELTRNSNNHFGIKALGGWSGRIYLAWDDETEKSRFRCYDSAAESFKDHSEFLKNNSRYRDLFTKSVYDYRGWANGLQRAGYATATNYAKALIGYIDAYQLYTVNGGVKLRAGKTVTITKTITREELSEMKELQLNESEVSEEQKSVTNTIQKFVVEINDVRCTILYPGETLSSIAMKYDIPKSKLLEFNETTSDEDLNEGDIVFLDKKKGKYQGAQDYYRVKEGDTLYGISQQFGIKLANLTKMNNKNLFSTLVEGEKLKLK